MKIALIAITIGGKALATRLNCSLKDVQVFIPSKLKDSEENSFTYYEYSTSELVNKIFSQFDGIIFVMATGIVVRIIGPLLKSKVVDPAVVVLDEKGNFAISLLSGHLGGANDLTLKVASVLGAQPVITTASDVQGKVAFDILAKKHNLYIENPEELVTANSALVNNRELNVYSDLSLAELDNSFSVSLYPLSKFLDVDFSVASVIITNQASINPRKNLLVLRPRNLVVGIGCRKGISLAKVQMALNVALARVDKDINSIKILASIDIKGHEQALLELKDTLNVPFETHDVPTLRKVYEQNRDISYSAFVAEEIGVGCVCETAALSSAKTGTMILPKMSQEGVTIAVVEENFGS